MALQRNYYQDRWNEKKVYEVFEPYGWYFEDEKERQVLDGTSELYRKEKKE